MSGPDERWLFDVLVALADHAHERGMDDVSDRIEEALDALIAHEAGAAVVPFRSARQGVAARRSAGAPARVRLHLKG